MTEPRLHVARGEAELGLFSRSEIKELMEAGYLLSSDQCWTEGQATRRTLAEAIQPPTSASRSILNRATSATAGVANALRTQAASLGERIVATTRRQQERVSAGTNHLLELSLPRLQQNVAEVLSRSTKSTSAALRNEDFLRKLFGAVYDTMPRPIYRFVSEEAFIAFCFTHQRKLVPPLQPPANPAQPPQP